jgi:predicted Zn-dependent protease
VGAGDERARRELRLRLVQVLARAGDPDRARIILAVLLKQEPKDRDALHSLAAIEEAQGKWDAASAAYRRLVALEEGHAVVDIALRLADACERASRVADARGGLERARMVAPEDEPLRKRLEQLYRQTGAFRELAEMSLSDARSTGDVAGRFAHLVRAGSLLLHEVADAEAAIAPLKEAQALRPSEHECIIFLADAYTAAGRTVEASELLNAAITSHKGRRSRELASLFHHLARVGHADGERQAELAWLTQSMDMDSQNGAVASELAILAMDLGQLDLANRALRVVTMLKNPAPMSKALAYQYMGEIARKQGDTKRAVMLLKRAVQEDASLTGARALLDHLLRE